MRPAAILTLALLFSFSSLLNSQISLNLDAYHKKLKTDITILYVGNEGSTMGNIRATNKTTGSLIYMYWADIKNLDLKPKNVEQVWQAELLTSKTYEKLVTSGMNNSIRNVLSELMKDFLSEAEQSGLLYIDSYLEARLYRLLRMVYGVRPTDGRSGLLSLRILSDIKPDAWIGPDGTLILTTGAITAVDSEEELLAMITQEVAHFVLDHHMVNYQAVAVAGYTPDLARVIRFDANQELEADKSAVAVLTMLGVRPAALSSVLSKMGKQGELTGDYYLTTSGTWPSAMHRIWAIHDTGTFFSPEYEKMISPIISFNARMASDRSQYLLCRWLLEKNIASGTATADDIVLLAQTMMKLSGTDQGDREALEMLHRVMTPGADIPPEAYKQEALILLRMGRYADSDHSFSEYLNALTAERDKYASMAGDWTKIIDYLNSEIDWVGRSRLR